MNIPYDQVFERSPIAKVLVDSEGMIRVANRELERLFGYGRDELIGNAVEMLVSPENRAQLSASVQDYFADPSSRPFGRGHDLLGVSRKGTLIPIEVVLNPIELEGESLVLAWIMDTTEQQRANEKFEAAVEAAPNGMLMINSERSIVLCNRQVEEVFGYSRDELIGQPIERLVPDEFKTAHPTFVDSYFETPEIRSMGGGRELFGRHKSGRLVPVEVGLRPFRVGTEMFVISSVVDITLRRTAELQAKRRTQEIEEFSYRTSHDLRAPLKSIAAMAECVIEDIGSGELDEAVDGAKQIRLLSSRVLQLTQDILTLAKIGTETGDLS